MSDILDEKRPTRGDARRDAIVQAARKVCLEKGFSKITVSDIASEVGMTRSLFYHYFEDKEAVADAVLDNVIDEILTTLKQWNQARETGNVNKALDDIVHVLRSLIADESPFSNRMIQDGNAELYIKFIDRAADRIADYIAQNIAMRNSDKQEARTESDRNMEPRQRAPVGQIKETPSVIAARCHPFPFWHFRATSPGRGSLSHGGRLWREGEVFHSAKGSLFEGAGTA